MTRVAKVQTLLVCDLVDSTGLIERLGDANAAALFRILDEHTRTLMERWQGREVDKTDGFLLLFDRPINAVRFAVAYHASLSAVAAPAGLQLRTRAGIHLGEVVLRSNPPAKVARGAKSLEVEGLAKVIAARLMALAQGGQTLLTRSAYEVALRSTVGADDTGPLLVWRAHGAYRLKGVTEPIEVFEVGTSGAALLPPVDSEKARRIKSTSRPGVLVLPFADLSPGAETEFISNGLTDEIITGLSTLRALRVISRTSAMQLKHTTKDIAALGSELNVQYVLEGSVQRIGATLLITAQLVRPEQDELVWAQSFRGEVASLFEIEEAIARSVAAALQMQLTAAETERLKPRPIPHPAAYEYFLRAEQQVYAFTEEALDRALQYLKKGEDVVGENTAIYAAMGYVYWQYVNLGVTSDPSFLEKARKCAERIRALDPASAEVERLLGLVTIHAEGDKQDAVRHLKRALEANPNDPDALFWLALLYGFMGRAASGIPLAERLLEIDPLTPAIHAVPPTLAALAGDFDRACTLFAKAHRMEPANPGINTVYAQALAMAGRRDEACTVLKQIQRDAPGSFYDGLSRVVLAAMHDERATAIAALRPQIETAARADMQYSWSVAQAFAILGDSDRAVDWLESAVNRGFANYPLIAERDPLLARIRQDRRFQELAHVMKKRWHAFEV